MPLPSSIITASAKVVFRTRYDTEHEQPLRVPISMATGQLEYLPDRRLQELAVDLLVEIEARQTGARNWQRVFEVLARLDGDWLAGHCEPITRTPDPALAAKRRRQLLGYGLAS